MSLSSLNARIHELAHQRVGVDADCVGGSRDLLRDDVGGRLKGAVPWAMNDFASVGAKIYVQFPGILRPGRPTSLELTCAPAPEQITIMRPLSTLTRAPVRLWISCTVSNEGSDRPNRGSGT